MYQKVKLDKPTGKKIISADTTLKMDNPYIGKEKKKKPKADWRRIIVCGSSNWKNRRAIANALKEIGYNNIEYIVTGISGKGAEFIALRTGLEHGLLVVALSPIVLEKSFAMRNTKAIQMFKPTDILCFHENLEDSPNCKMYQRIARKKNIEFKVHVK